MGAFPSEWSEAILKPILKPGKDPNEPTSYRPISLTSCMCEIIERLINRRLLHVIEERRLLPETQYGFRKNRSTTDVLITLDSLISEAIRKKSI
jgi:hypothetical protein